MKYGRSFAVAFLLNLFAVQVVFGDTFGGKFRTWLLGSEAQASTLEHDQSKLDVIAQGCIECHNGALATHITVKNANSPQRFSFSGVQVNHPIGMNYDDYAAKKAHSYTPRFSLDPNIILVDGQVTCVSCHRLKGMTGSESLIDASWNKDSSLRAGTGICSASKELTVGPRETDLCLACHNM